MNKLLVKTKNSVMCVFSIQRVVNFRFVSSMIHTLWLMLGLISVYDNGTGTTSSKESHTFWKTMISPSAFWLFINVLRAGIYWYLDIKRFITFPGVTSAIYFSLILLGDIKVLLIFSICTVTRLRNLQSFIKQLITVDHYIPVQENECNKLLRGFLLMLHVAMLIRIGLIATPNLSHILHILFHWLIDSVTVLQFVVLMLELWGRLCKINTCLLEEICHPDPGVVQLLAQPQSPSPARRLRHLRESYVSLGRAADLLGLHSGLPVAPDTAVCVLGTTCSAYELLIMIESPHHVNLLPFSQSVNSSVLWLVYHILKLVAVSLSCAMVQDAAERTATMLRRSPVLPPGISAEVDAFLRVTSQDPPLRFTASGFVNVDRHLLVAALGIVITYLVVIGQPVVYQH